MKGNLKEKMRKRDCIEETLLIIFIFFSILSVIIQRPVEDLDEIWNYNFAKTISEGLVPYKDVNMVTTPLLPMVNAVFLKLIANELWVMRLLAALLATSIVYMVYKNLRLLLKEKNICFLMTAVIGFIYKDYFCIDYNFVVLWITLMILYKELKNSTLEKKCGFKENLLIRLISRDANLYKTNGRNCGSICSCVL